MVGLDQFNVPKSPLLVKYTIGPYLKMNKIIVVKKLDIIEHKLWMNNQVSLL